VENRLIEIVVDLPQNGNQSVVVNATFFVGKRFPGTEFFEDVVHSRQGEIRMQFLLPLAMGIEPLTRISHQRKRRRAENLCKVLVCSPIPFNKTQPPHDLRFHPHPWKDVRKAFQALQLIG